MKLILLYIRTLSRFKVYTVINIIGLALSGKSSVSCPLKPSDSAPLKHSTMPP